MSNSYVHILKMAGVSQLNTSASHMCMCVCTLVHTHRHMQETLTLSLNRPRSSGILAFTQVIRSICYWSGGGGGSGGILRTQNVIRVPTVNHLSCPSLKGQPLQHAAPCGLYCSLWRKPSEKVFFLFFIFFTNPEEACWAWLLSVLTFQRDRVRVVSVNL